MARQYMIGADTTPKMFNTKLSSEALRIRYFSCAFAL